MGTVHPDYLCKCHIPTPLIKWSEEVGICSACNCIYDETLYEMRCRQHIPGWTYETVSDYIAANDPNYADLIKRS